MAIIKINGLIRVKIPRVPKYLIDVHDGKQISIEDISEDSLREIGKAWTEALIKKSK